MKAAIMAIVFIIWSLLGLTFYLGADIYCVRPSWKVALISGPLAWFMYSGEELFSIGKDYQARNVNWDTGKTR